ncbi:serine/threonine-protein phosphatase [Streptomyces gardneri]|uniref:PP2C family protein-serine/threonine phosphatase n=1 Tax=Nocardia TaxID=1817 RepID=UPI0013580783|nr:MULTISPECIES: PP2C family protein-serine/threonine phosphatase [Nocardia]MBF6168532.1 serine/threonine-protein phosphatase [Streptomyces gardneri]MBF6207795.1 serine/threonine-protein phosphatase [Streptomyces gardneri]
MSDDFAADRGREQQRSLFLALKGAELSLEQLWLRYFGLGGVAGYLDIDAYAHSTGELPPLERDILAQAANERLDELTWSKHATFSRPIRDGEAPNAALSALLQLLKGTDLAPPDRLPAVTDAAGQALGVHITIYLADYDQRYLHPIPPGFANGHAAATEVELDIDSTLAGRAFRQVQMLPSHTSGGARLWVPLVDGAERLGVLRVAVDDPDDLYDPGLRMQCRWVSQLAGHMVTLVSQYGDAFDRIRLRTPRTVSGELIWSLLPPLTAGVDSFVVTGVVEPRHDVSGDAFDYALSEGTASLLVLDAVGHDLRSGLITATALAAYRGARHAGRGLFEQARTMDEHISDQFGSTVFATAVLTELDLRSGRLRYINAGHPDPLLMREGKVVKPLHAGHCRPLGLGLGDLRVGEEVLQPADWLVLYTDGITEARDHTGEFFGEARLFDFLRREAAAGYPPPETARRLIKAVLSHQNGELQDDATVLLARWTQPRQLTP